MKNIVSPIPLAETGWCTGTAADDFQQEAVIQTGYKDKETHGGADVFFRCDWSGSRSVLR